FPVLLAESGKGGSMGAALDRNSLREAFRLRRAFEIGADMRKSFAFDDRTDVVEHGGAQERWPDGRQGMDDQSAPRRSDEMAMRDAGDDKTRHHILRLDCDLVVPPVSVIGRLAAAAIVEGNDLAPGAGAGRQ